MRPIQGGADHWLGLAERMLELHSRHGGEAAKAIADEVEGAFL
jgi:hypothetical protein